DLLPQANKSEPKDTKAAEAEAKPEAKPADKLAEPESKAKPAAAPAKPAPVPAKAAKAEAKEAAPAGAVSVTIPWEEPTAAAVFRRADFTWVVFDRYRNVDIAALQKAGGPDITFIEQLPVRNNTILRMITPPDVNASVRRDGLSW